MTLRSRCMVINFERVSESDIKRSLEIQNIVNAGEIAVISNGSLGHAFKLAASDGLKIRNDALDFLESIATLSIEDIFNRGQALSAQSKENFREWTIHLQKFLRDLLIVNDNVDDNYYYNRDLKNKLLGIRNKFKDSAIFEILHETAEIQRRLNSNANLELLIESFFIRVKRIIY